MSKGSHLAREDPKEDATQPEWTPSHLVKRRNGQEAPYREKEVSLYFVIKTSRDAKKDKKRSHLVKRPREPRNVMFFSVKRT